MDDRKLLEEINYGEPTIVLESQLYELKGTRFQAVQLGDLKRSLEEEQKMIDSLTYSFQYSLRMQKYMTFLIEGGGMYLMNNQRILLHDYIPVDEKGQLLVFELNQPYRGKELLGFFEEQITESTEDLTVDEDLAAGLIWYAWSGSSSPLFGKSKMATFGCYFLTEPYTHVEKSNFYYHLQDEEWFSEKILAEFDAREEGSAIINGHAPVKVRKGESPIKANGKAFVIDGGLSKAYQKTTRIVGCSLLCNSYGSQIVTHYPFLPIEQQFTKKSGQTSVEKMVKQQLPCKLNRNMTKGMELQQQIIQLQGLLDYRKDD